MRLAFCEWGGTIIQTTTKNAASTTTGMWENPAFATKAMHSYMLCGWRTYSEIPLTSVPTVVNDAGNLDVVIEVATDRSPFTESTDRFVFQHSLDRSLIKIKGVADFEVKKGRQICVWPAPGAAQKDIEIFLFGQAWATLCHQRGMLPLHSSAIVSGNGIIAFAGRAGAGKSTTAALLNSLGFELVTDDILPVSFDQNSLPGAWPYLRRLKLHLDPISQFGLTANGNGERKPRQQEIFRSAGTDRRRQVEKAPAPLPA